MEPRLDLKLAIHKYSIHYLSIGENVNLPLYLIWGVDDFHFYSHRYRYYSERRCADKITLQ
jgi:hypothetical protein